MTITSSLSGTRLNILTILQREGSMTVDQLAREIGLSSTTIRRHLDILQRDLLVSFDQIRQGSGRPEYRYSLTEDGHESGYRDYKSFLIDLIGEISGLSSTDLASKNGKELLSFLFARIIPAPKARSASAFSWSRTVQPRCDSAIAATRPAKPPPAISA